jgi:hypothetical protein
LDGIVACGLVVFGGVDGVVVVDVEEEEEEDEDEDDGDDNGSPFFVDCRLDMI